jgi:hypothetical protein
MASRSAIKLFAVVALAGACDSGKKPVQKPAPQQPAQPRPAAQQPQAQPAAAVTREPRTLPSGRPACGNVGGKAPRRPECENLR